MKIKKKVGKKWGKIKLLETSAVGIPMYDYAINKAFRSLIKALRETEEPKEKLNLEKSPMEDGEAQATPESEVSEPAEEQKAEPEAEPEKSEAEAEKPEEAPEEVKGVSREDMMDMMTKGFQAAIKASSTPRGLVEPTEEDKVEKYKDVLAKKSIGELAIMNGMFKAPDMYGRV